MKYETYCSRKFTHIAEIMKFGTDEVIIGFAFLRVLLKDTPTATRGFGDLGLHALMK